MSGVDRRDLQLLARIRLQEARALLKGGHSDGAYYLAGYAVECGLKACIAKGIERYEFPDKKKVDASHTHNLRELIRVANLEKARLDEASRDPAFRDNWDVVQAWSEQSRYWRSDAATAQRLVKAIGDGKHGALSWIRRYW